MELPVQITYRGLDSTEALSDLIRKESDKLDKFFDRIVACRVLVEREQHHLRSGTPFRVRLDLTVPGAELDVDAAHKDAALTVREAFRRARRRLQDSVRAKIKNKP